MRRRGAIGSRPVLLASFFSRFLMSGSMGTLTFVEECLRGLCDVLRARIKAARIDYQNL